MVKIEFTEVFGTESAMRAMRNPKNSWIKNDTKGNEIGPNDMKLAKALISGGSEHRKFLRQIIVTADFVIPAYLAAEFDTYKIGTTRNSCSLQHKGDSREFTVEDFTFDELNVIPTDIYKASEEDKQTIVNIVNRWRKLYLDSNKTDYTYFRLMRQFMPMGYNYRFTWTTNYEVLLTIHRQRKNHKLKEWHEICKWIESLPNMKEFLSYE